MERIQENRPSGIGGNALRLWGMVFLAAGILGRGVLQNHILGVSGVSAEKLMEILSNTEGAMGMVAISLVLQAVETCAAPIFAFLLVEGMQHTSNRTGYFLRVLGVAVLSELPYNLAMSGKLLDMGSRNPVFGLVLGMIMLLFHLRYTEKGLVNVLIKVAVAAAGIVWALMLKVDNGAPMVLLIAVLWGLRKRPAVRNLVGASAVMVCTVFSPFFLAAPMGFLALHMYNGEKSTTSHLVNYLTYPALLLFVGIAGMFL